MELYELPKDMPMATRSSLIVKGIDYKKARWLAIERWRWVCPCRKVRVYRSA